MQCGGSRCSCLGGWREKWSAVRCMIADTFPVMHAAGGAGGLLGACCDGVGAAQGGVGPVGLQGGCFLLPAPCMPEMHDGKDPWIMGLAGRWKMHGLHMQDGMGTANTSVAFHNKQLLALHEADFPYAVRTCRPCCRQQVTSKCLFVRPDPSRELSGLIPIEIQGHIWYLPGLCRVYHESSGKGLFIEK